MPAKLQPIQDDPQDIIVYQNNLHKSAKGIALEDIVDLRAKGLSLNQIAKTLGCTSANVYRRLQAVDYKLDLTHKYRRNRAVVFAFEQNRIRQSISDADISKASLRDKVLSMAILYDKERLETGQSTQNIAYADMVQARDQARQARLALEAGGV